MSNINKDKYGWKMINPLQLNDLEIKKFLFIIFSLQIALWGIILIDINIVSVHLLRDLVTFICLLFIPGIILLRILRMHNLGNIKTLAYSVGLSLFLVMFLGFFMNIIYPLLGNTKPLYLWNLMFNFTIMTLILCLVAYYRDKSFFNPSFVNFDYLSPSLLFILILPFFSILGTYLMNYYQTNLLSLLLVVYISSIVLLMAFDKIPKAFYPLTIFLTSVSLLYSCSLISSNLWGWDIQIEYYFANSVVSNSIWDYAIHDNTNSMLSIAMFAPILSIVSDLNLTWIFKIVFPFLLSLVPLILFEIFRKQTNEKIAAFSALFFVFFYSFFIETVQIGKQVFAEFFVVLFILLLLDKKITKFNKSIFLLIFSAAIIVSHYGTSYVYLLLLAISAFLMLSFGFLENKLKDLDLKAGYASFNIFEGYKNVHFSLTFIIFFLVFALAWYIYISDSSALWTITKIGNHVLSNLFDFLNPERVQGLSYLASSKNSILREIAKYMQLASQFFIVIGFGFVFFKREKFNFSNDYVILSFAALIILFIGISVPFFGSALNTSRLYQLMLILLSPFCVIGGLKLFKFISSSINLNFSSSKMFSVFLIIFLLFNTGFVYEITDDQSQMISINTKIKDHYPLFDDKELNGVQWLIGSTNKSYNKFYADRYNTLLFYRFGATVKTFPFDANDLKVNNYIYFGTSNLINLKIPYINKTTSYGSNTKDNYLKLDDYNKGTKIYDNGGSQVYYT